MWDKKLLLRAYLPGSLTNNGHVTCEWSFLWSSENNAASASLLCRVTEKPEKEKACEAPCVTPVPPQHHHQGLSSKARETAPAVSQLHTSVTSPDIGKTATVRGQNQRVYVNISYSNRYDRSSRFYLQIWMHKSICLTAKKKYECTV